MQKSAAEFLSAVLPEQGFKVATVKLSSDPKDRRTFNIVTQTCEELATEILRQDAMGRTVWHACASYAENIEKVAGQQHRMRVKENVLFARSLWCEIDTGGANDPYKTLPDAVDALRDFCGRAGLPVPLLVASGHGLHVYWPFDTAITREQWERRALGLKQLCADYGLQVDPKRTADIASVLRTPGAHNRKHGDSVLVQHGQFVGPYPLTAFDHLTHVELHLPVYTPQSPLADQTTTLLGGMANVTSYSASYAAAVGEQCQQVRMLRDTHGNIPEPQWYAALGVLAYCVDGEDAAHNWSSGYAGYTFEETQWKLERTRNLSGATTCAKFADVHAAGCGGCPFRGRINSPVSLGRVQPLAEQPTLFPDTPDTVDTTPLPALPQPWRWGPAGQLLMDVGTAIGDSEVLISEYPIYLDYVQTGEVDGSRYSYVFKQWLPMRGWIDIAIGAKALHSPGGIAEMSERGATIHDTKAFVSYVRYAVDAFHRVNEASMRYDQFGWKEDDSCFLYGDVLYRPADSIAVSGSGEVRARAPYLRPTESGSLERWSQAANELFVPGCEPQAFALLASFATPLIKFQSSDEGGAVVCFHSTASGQGKTTALVAAASVWGPLKWLSLTNIDTDVSKAVTLGTLGNLPVIFDEFRQTEAELVRDFVVMFTNGRDKKRGTVDGGIIHRNAFWQTIMLLASNNSLIDTLLGVGSSDAPAYRVIEFPMALPPGVKHQRGDRLIRALQSNAGHAGDAYLQYLMQPDVLKWAKDALQLWTDELWTRTGFKSEHRFWIRTLGAVAVASALVNKLGILNFSPQRIVDWAVEFLTQPETRDYSAVSAMPADMRYVHYLSEFMNDNLDSTLIMAHPYRQGERNAPALVKPQRRLSIRYNISNKQLLVAETHFRQWLLKREISARELLRVLSSRRIVLNHRKLATLAAGTDMPGGQTLCIEIDASHAALSGMLHVVSAKDMPRAANDS